MKATILCIGDELLIGQTLNTNAQWMSQKMNEVGIDVLHHVSLSDDRKDIIRTLEEAMAASQLVLITGGLGPTSDDITKDVLCDYFDGTLVFNEEAFQNIQTIYNRRRINLTEDSKKMSLVPDNCIVIQNTVGSAPGMLFRRQDKIVVSMPGVPYEMRSMIEHAVIPYLRGNFSLPVILHTSILTAGVGETILSERLRDFEKTKDERIKLAYLPNVGKVRLRLTIKGDDREVVEKLMADAKEKVIDAVAEYIYGFDDDSLEKNIGALLLQKNYMLGTAESCTGGYLAHLVTSVAGSSDYYKGSVIAYSNEIKMQVLKVKEETLQGHGAVSEETVREMIAGALGVLNVDIAVGLSGVAGPSGGSEDKPVGTVFIGVGTKEQTIVKRLSFTNNRERNIQLSGVVALVMLRNFLLGRLKG